LAGEVEKGEDEYIRCGSLASGGAARPSVGVLGMLTGAVNGLGVLWEMVRTGVNWLCADCVLLSFLLADAAVALEAVFVTTGDEPPAGCEGLDEVLSVSSVVDEG
jgi:hypothetical protein